MKGKFAIIRKVYIWLIVAAMLVGGAWLIFVQNVRLSSEFTWGVKLTITNTVDKQKLSQDMKRALQEQGFGNTEVEADIDGGNTNITVNTSIKDDKKVQLLSKSIQSFLVEDKYISNTDEIINQAITGPSVWSYMQRTALIALARGLLFMAIYMLISFSGIRKYVKPEVLAVVTIVTMLFDISIPIGAYGFWMMINPTIQVDTIFIIAILTTMWYSINDTIIIFDRVRENMQKEWGKAESKIIFGRVFEKSLRQTMRRSMGTSISTLLVIIAMFFLGTGVIQRFAFTMGVGVVAGTFSSIFLAAPLAYLMLGKFKKEKKALVQSSE